MWNWFTCHVSARHEYGVWCEPGTVFLRCVHCGRRSSGWSVDARAMTPIQEPARPRIESPLDARQNTAAHAEMRARSRVQGLALSAAGGSPVKTPALSGPAGSAVEGPALSAVESGAVRRFDRRAARRTVRQKPATVAARILAFPSRTDERPAA